MRIMCDGFADGVPIQLDRRGDLLPSPPALTPLPEDDPDLSPPVLQRPEAGFDPVAPQIGTAASPLPGESDRFVAERQADALASAERELKNKVQAKPDQTGPRISDYAKAAQMKPGMAWCGYFAGFNLHEAGFRHAPAVASTYKARDFFLYGSEFGNDKALETDDKAGSHRKMIVLAGSNLDKWIKSCPKAKPGDTSHHKARTAYTTDHVEVAPDYHHLNIRPGDIVLLNNPKDPANSLPYHIGMVKSYDPATGALTTVEGNIGSPRQVMELHYDLSKKRDLQQIGGFGRPSAADFAEKSPSKGLA